MATKSEVQDMQQEHQREMEALLESVRQISSEVKRLSLICDYFIPQEYLQLIQEHTHWNDEIGEWQLVSLKYNRLIFFDCLLCLSGSCISHSKCSQYHYSAVVSIL